jgi:Rps23 Pro-64 3,4-dihydroxylase Tpa1-like proline 4-hydroxylase
MNYINEINQKIKSSKIEWQLEPFPHAVIDDFFPKEVFAEIVKGLDDVDEFKDLKKNFSTDIENNKKVYGDSDLSEVLRIPINVLGGETVKSFFEKYFNGQKIVSMCDWPEYGGAYPFHKMTDGGVLGSHVDHSHSKTGELHVANSIFYASSEWNDSWGGETLLFDNMGINIKKKIIPKPNRAILFVHSASTFHGVNKINSPEGIKRSTYYMDYYINDKNLNNVKNALMKKGYKKINYTFHTTAFMPFFPLGFKSFKIKSLFLKSNYSYLKVFFKYLISRFLLSYKVAGIFKNKNI